MSNLDPKPTETYLISGSARKLADSTVTAVDERVPARELLAGHPVALGGPRGLTVTRTLPNRDRRMVGAWCFLDHYGPEVLSPQRRMTVPPHPHTGLQTVSWLIEGEIQHDDSLGSTALVRPGQLSLMTAGSGIAHSEQTPTRHGPTLHGLQLWIALPGNDRNTAPHFEHHRRLPVLADAGCAVTVVIGELAGTASPASAYSRIVGAQIALDGFAETHLPIAADFEHAALATSGTVWVDDVELSPGPLLYLGAGRVELSLRAERPARLLLIGGEPFAEQIVMWWNFVARDHDEIFAARRDWMHGARFGIVTGFDGPPLPAPALPNSRLKARGRVRQDPGDVSSVT